MDDAYRPVACGFHDELTLLVMRRRTCRLRFLRADGVEEATRQRPVDVLTRAGAEYLRLEDGRELRLDRLLEVTPD